MRWQNVTRSTQSGIAMSQRTSPHVAQGEFLQGERKVEFARQTQVNQTQSHVDEGRTLLHAIPLILCGCTVPVQDLPQQAAEYAALFFIWAALNVAFRRLGSWRVSRPSFLPFRPLVKSKCPKSEKISGPNSNLGLLGIG